jgi:ribose-phosphate pyrophosphokinase
MSSRAIEAKIFACGQSKELAEKIAATFGVPLGNVITSTYSDGEFQPSYEESIRGSRVFIIGSTHPGPKKFNGNVAHD